MVSGTVCVVQHLRFCVPAEVFFRFPFCMKAFGTGNTFSAERCAVERQRL